MTVLYENLRLKALQHELIIIVVTKQYTKKENPAANFTMKMQS